jgi:CPA1 family monovalent cation:H+ antiporter
MLELALSLTHLRDLWLSEALHISGVLSVVAAGLYRARWAHRHISALARLNIRTFWRAVVFVVNCLVFVLMGIQLPQIAVAVSRPEALSWGQVAGLIAMLSAVASRVRFLWIFTATYGVRRLPPSVRRRDPASSRSDLQLVWYARRRLSGCCLRCLRWCSELFPQRDLIILLERRHRIRDVGGSGPDVAGVDPGAPSRK